jgi:hypothetical protein
MSSSHRSWTALWCLGAVALAIACGDSTNPDPNVPKLLSPAEAEVLDNGCVPDADSIVWNFDWADVPGATAYELFVSNGTGVFSTIDDSTITASNYHFSQANNYTNSTTGWLWWVRAKVDGSFHDWAGPRDFSVEAVNTDCP